MSSRKMMKILVLSIIVSLGVNLLSGCSSTKAGKTNFPEKAIEIIVPYAAGGGTDSVARAISEAAKDTFPKPVVVVNKTGGGGAVGMAEGAKAKPDGYTVTMVTVELVTLPPMGLAPFTYKDFKPVLQINADPSALTVRADAPWNTLDEFIQYAKNNPGKIQIGNSGSGAIWHLAAAAIEQKTGVKFNHVPFDGAAPAVTALLGGHIDAVTVSPAEVSAQIKAGKLKILAVASENRIEQFPDVKTFKEQGVDVVVGTWRGFAVPKDTPDEIVKILQEGFKKAAEKDSFKEFMNKAGLGIEVKTGQEFLDRIQKDSELFDNLIKSLGLAKK
ncbi:tripartite tricarboxylate transporter substrate-binding protein [Thermoanaerobacterium sp. DL9XJH110]|uniref:tripartite tricarboxylate transporter substrate-binding protein n=1 Tax=Thermoanaerobacterium sp. DL9XJH110 TaxID=3386643 RepID=UPI003BB61E92